MFPDVCLQGFTSGKKYNWQIMNSVSNFMHLSWMWDFLERTEGFSGITRHQSITSSMYSCEMNTSLLPLVLRKPRGAGNLRCYHVFIANCSNAEESQSTDFSRRVSSLAVLPVHPVSAVLCMEMVASCFLCLLCLHSRTASKRSSRKPRAPPMSPAVRGRLLSLG